MSKIHLFILEKEKLKKIKKVLKSDRNPFKKLESLSLK